mmetsp:Transcript_45175/g.70823  ORF Transcript_45175/g.70823 Transcript_45175/m.70823 type:complete len:260 (+) Transcript_45175:267-1046(+)
MLDYYQTLELMMEKDRLKPRSTEPKRLQTKRIAMRNETTMMTRTRTRTWAQMPMEKRAKATLWALLYHMERSPRRKEKRNRQIVTKMASPRVPRKETAKERQWNRKTRRKVLMSKLSDASGRGVGFRERRWGIQRCTMILPRRQTVVLLGLVSREGGELRFCEMALGSMRQCQKSSSIPQSNLTTYKRKNRATPMRIPQRRGKHAKDRQKGRSSGGKDKSEGLLLPLGWCHGEVGSAPLLHNLTKMKVSTIQGSCCECG